MISQSDQLNYQEKSFKSIGCEHYKVSIAIRNSNCLDLVLLICTTVSSMIPWFASASRIPASTFHWFPVSFLPDPVRTFRHGLKRIQFSIKIVYVFQSRKGTSALFFPGLKWKLPHSHVYNLSHIIPIRIVDYNTGIGFFLQKSHVKDKRIKKTAIFLPLCDRRVMNGSFWE